MYIPKLKAPPLPPQFSKTKKITPQAKHPPLFYGSSAGPPLSPTFNCAGTPFPSHAGSSPGPLSVPCNSGVVTTPGEYISAGPCPLGVSISATLFPSCPYNSAAAPASPPLSLSGNSLTPPSAWLADLAIAPSGTSFSGPCPSTAW